MDLTQAPGVVTDLDSDSGSLPRSTPDNPPASHGERKVYIAEVRTLNGKVFWKEYSAGKIEGAKGEEGDSRG